METPKVVKIGTVVLAALMVVSAAELRQVIKNKFLTPKTEDVTIQTSIVPYTLDQIQGGNYYVKDGDVFYAVAPGLIYSSAKGDSIIPEKADPEHRIAMFGQDDSQIPTLYSDTQLIYKASTSGEAVPTEFILERFKDEGYSIGIRGLSKAEGSSKYKLTVSDVSFYPGSSITAMKCKTGDELTIDKVGGTAVTEENISSGGTVTGLKQGQSYSMDIYSGTDFIGMEAVADTHMFTSFEKFTFTDYTMNQDGYMMLTMPDVLRSGYYYINGVGMFRYSATKKAEGLNSIGFNTPYYLGEDENGNIITNPEKTDKASDTKPEPTSMEDFTWTYNLTIDNPQKQLDLSVNYSDARAIVNGSLVSESEGAVINGVSTPSAIITDPDGKDYELKDEDGKSLRTSIQNPGTGTWTITMKGMYARTFDVNSSFAGNYSNMIVKNGTDDVTMPIYLEEDLHGGIFHFTWEDTSHAGTFEFKVGDKTYGNKADPTSILKETYGSVDLAVGEIPAGDITITIKGESLGKVRLDIEKQ